jgi:hypothetical protein
MPTRRPRGYIGKDHETIGSDILSIYHCLRLPVQILGEAEVEKLKKVDPNGWYPIAWPLELMETLDRKVGHYGLIAMGRTLFKMSHEENAKKVLKSAKDLVYALDGLYHNANRGEGIGGWKVTKFDKGVVELEKNTPHHCVMEQGILAAAFDMVGAPSMIAQRECFRTGADLCVYTVTSAVTDARWTG